MSKLALITGCLGGIGRALVKAFDEAGYTVVGLDIPPSAPHGGDLPRHYYSVDLGQLCTDTAYRESAFRDLKACLDGQLDVLINNAAYQVVKPLAQLSLDDWQRTQNVNVAAPFLLTQGLLPELEALPASMGN
jgi:NAD(P)-dependent dehydrogenase (short-subunit alcohol dehydrogenase family)